MQAVSDRSIVVISTLPPSLTGSRGKYFRVVGNVAATIDQTPFEARIFHFGGVPIAKLTNQTPIARSFLLHDSSCDIVNANKPPRYQLK